MKYIQSFCKALGNEGCYIFCLFDIARQLNPRKYNVLDEIETFINLNYVYFNPNNYDDPKNLYVYHPTKILEYLTGKKWTVRVEQGNYQPQKDEFVVEYWSRDGGKTGHFARMQYGFNSLEKSRSVNEGQIYSYRVFKEI